MDELIGTTIGGCTIESKIVQGGGEAVFKGHHTGLDIPVTIKVLDYSSAMGDAEEHFLREARITAKLKHPNIATVLNVGIEEGKHFIVMEYVNGEPLLSRVERQGPLPEDEVITIALKLLETLQTLDKNGVVYHEVKPGNIIIDDRGAVRLVDLDLARIDQQPLGSDLTDTLTVSAQSEVSNVTQCRLDIYSLGCTLYYLLSGTSPIPGCTTVEGLTNQLHLTPPGQHITIQSITPNLSKIIEKMLEINSDRCYSTLEEIINDIVTYQKNDLVPLESEEVYDNPIECLEINTDAVEYLEVITIPVDRHEPVADPVDRHESVVDPVVDRHEAVVDPVDRHESVVDPVDRHESVADPVDRHESVADPVDRHEAVADPVDRHEAVVDPVDRHESVVDPVDRHESVVDPVDRHEAVVDPVDRHEAVVDPVDRHEAVVDPVDRHEAASVKVDSRKRPISSQQQGKSRKQAGKKRSTVSAGNSLENWVVFFGSIMLISMCVVIALVMGKQLYLEHIVPIKNQLLQSPDVSVRKDRTLSTDAEQISSELLVKKSSEVGTESSPGNKTQLKPLVIKKTQNEKSLK